MLFPKILSEKKIDRKIILDIFISEDIYYFKGHFPNFPVLPGIVQIHWAFYYIKKYFNINVSIKNIPVVKFTNIIHPNTNLFLIIEKVDNAYSFLYQKDDVIFSSAKLYTEDN